MAKKTGTRIWMRVLGKEDVGRLRDLLVARNPKRQKWEYKLHRDNIIIYVPITPWNPETHKPDPSERYMAKHLRVVPRPDGPFQLEYMRHTGQWWPFIEAVGDLEAIADFIEEDPYGQCSMFDSEE
ncbi:MAG: DUF3024 domain-containing protein [Planctomycetota bacterium]|jgi:hypothetical protein